MDGKEKRIKSVELLERLKQDDSQVGCAVAHALGVDCCAMSSCSACSVETCNRMGKLIWQDMNDYVSQYRIHSMNIFDAIMEINLLNEKIKQLEHDRKDTLDGMTIHEWKVAYKQLEAKYTALQIDNDSLVEDNRKLFRKLTALTLYCQRMPLSVEEIFKGIDADMKRNEESN